MLMVHLGIGETGMSLSVGKLRYVLSLIRHYRDQLRKRRFRKRDWRQQKDQYFVTHYLRSKKPVYERSPGQRTSIDSWGIVMQGPLLSDNNYTLNTLTQYRKWFPESPVIFSTWNDQNPETLDKIRGLGCDVLVSDTQEFEVHSANSNFNRQLHSSHLGIAQAARLGVKFAVKTRSDQRIYNPHSLESLQELLRKFELRNAVNQNARIAVSSLNTFALRLYGVSDMFTFGQIDDLLVYWNGRLDLRKVSNSGGFSRSYATNRNMEVFLATNFLENCGDSLEWTLADYWDSLARRFLVVDSNYLDLHWPKYRPIENRWSWNNDKRSAEVSFAMWLGMLNGSLICDESQLNSLY